MTGQTLDTAPGQPARVPAWTLPDRLRKARDEAGLSQVELARAMGVARNTISNYEAGATPPRRPILLSWATACRVDLEWIQGGSQGATNGRYVGDRFSRELLPLVA